MGAEREGGILSLGVFSYFVKIMNGSATLAQARRTCGVKQYCVLEAWLMCCVVLGGCNEESQPLCRHAAVRRAGVGEDRSCRR